jgi:hypothetical protein
MARRKNLLKSRELILTVAPELHEDLENLVQAARGRYGKNATEAAERLVAEGLMALAREGLLLRQPRPEPD